MRNFHKKRGWRNIVQSKPVLMLFGILILFFAWNILGFWGKMEETGKNKKIVEDKVAALRQQKEKLLSDIGSLKTDAGKEKLFRENFGLAKEGENMIVVVEDKGLSATLIKAPPSGFWGFLRNWFK